MKKLVCGSLVALMLLAASSVSMASYVDFTLYNDSGYTITYWYVSPDYSNSWEEDVLGSNVLYSGSSMYLNIPDYYDNYCYWDIKIILETGDEAQWSGVDLCSVGAVTVYVQGNGIYADMQ